MFRVISCSSSGESIVSIQNMVYVTVCRWPFCVQVGKFLTDLHTKQSPTHSDIYQMLYWYSWFSWWWARDCSKHVENWNKYIEKNCVSSWSFTKNLNKMHVQQNIKFCWQGFRKNIYLIEIHRLTNRKVKEGSLWCWSTTYLPTDVPLFFKLKEI